jgi:hypothetical protein
VAGAIPRLEYDVSERDAGEYVVSPGGQNKLCIGAVDLGRHRNEAVRFTYALQHG